MALNQTLIAELQHEAGVTRRFLELYDEAHAAWKPHEKSMSLNALAIHLGELLTWTGFTMQSSVLDFAEFDYKPPVFTTKEEILAFFDKNVADAVEALQNSGDAQFMEDWTMRNGEKVYFTMPKIAVIRSFVLNHSVHHRAQYGLYLRLLNIPVPGAYGPTADKPEM